MKTVRMTKDYDYFATPKYLVAYKAGTVVTRVPEAAVEAIIAAGAGEVVGEVADDEEDATEQPKPKRGNRRPAK